MLVVLSCSFGCQRGPAQHELSLSPSALDAAAAHTEAPEQILCLTLPASFDWGEPKLCAVEAHIGLGSECTFGAGSRLQKSVYKSGVDYGTPIRASSGDDELTSSRCSFRRTSSRPCCSSRCTPEKRYQIGRGERVGRDQGVDGGPPRAKTNADYAIMLRVLHGGLRLFQRVDKNSLALPRISKISLFVTPNRSPPNILPVCLRFGCCLSTPHLVRHAASGGESCLHHALSSLVCPAPHVRDSSCRHSVVRPETRMRWMSSQLCTG